MKNYCHENAVVTSSVGKIHVVVVNMWARCYTAVRVEYRHPQQQRHLAGNYLYHRID